tara:strand:+ start:195 stop:557 length:363 start_codon:yes stop_codon:yes gene_type:complete
MDWCIKSFKDANHHPVIAINGDVDERIHYLDVEAGKSVILDASASFDPDKHNLKFNWWIYKEAGSFNEVNDIIKESSNPTVEITIPKTAKGKTIHVILELEDDNPIVSLRDYRRIVIKVN